MAITQEPGGPTNQFEYKKKKVKEYELDIT